MTLRLGSLLFLILIFYATCREEKLIQPEEQIRPFVSVPNYESISENIPKIQVLDELNPQSYAAPDIISKIKTVKCLNLDEYSIYDIKGLGANSLEGNTEVAREYKFNISTTNHTILFNFCYNLKKSERCPHENYQVFYLKNDADCQPIAGDINNGNKWQISREKDEKTNSTIDIIEITVNQYLNHTFKYILTCDPDGKDQSYTVTGKDFDDTDGRINLTLHITSKEACPKVNFYFIVKFIQDYKILFIILLILFGLFNCGFGKRFSRFTAFFLCIFIFVVLILILSQYVLPSGCANWIIWVMLAVGVILGVVAGVFAFKYHEGCMAFLTGGIGGFFLGQFLYSLFGNRIPVNGLVMNIVFTVVSIGVLIGIAFSSKKFIVIFATSFIGSYCIIRGISLFAGKFPDEMTIIDLTTRGETDQLKELLTWQVYVYLGAIVVATIISMIIQYKTYKEEKPKESDSKEGILMRTAE